ncbi:acyltransferase family protein [Ancylobacter mangrovi]|uniref:acyltransferase family protein n=1 Tax=Ancylobacter mangrovi TaxID=2972472 RepID=UPI002161E50E|nr:acyltransferase [Ancylobacter mangrovi]MCS0501121.1 acyltransferase [Ancylobacter mangrovi]
MKSSAVTDRFDALDAWRGLAAIMVLIYHFIYIVKLDFIYSRFVTNAYLFVDFFFVLSGFVVCHAYRDRMGSARQAGGFLLRRIGRLWPLHLTVLFALMLGVMAVNLGGRLPDSLMIEAGTGGYSMQGLLLNAALLNSMGFYGVAWNGPAWSIGAEFYTYVLFAAVLLAAGSRRLLPVALALSLASTVTLLIVAPAYMNSTADYGFLRCIAGFFAGVGAYHLHERMRGRALPAATVLEIAAVLLAGLFIVAAGMGPDSASPLSVAAPAVFALAILVFARQGGLASRLLTTRPFRALGAWSYSIYLIHMPLLILLGFGLWLYGDVTGASLKVKTEVLGDPKLLYDLGHPLAATALLVAFAAAVIALASLSYRLIEVPWRDRFARLARNHETSGRTLAPLPPRSVAPTPVPVRVSRDLRR